MGHSWAIQIGSGVTRTGRRRRSSGSNGCGGGCGGRVGLPRSSLTTSTPTVVAGRTWGRLTPAAAGARGARCAGEVELGHRRGAGTGELLPPLWAHVRWRALAYSCLFFYVAIVVYRCDDILGMLQSVTFMAQSFVVHVVIVVNMLRLCYLHVSVPCKCFKIRSKFFDVADINFRCCRC
jgi:hypothetical protein